MLGSQTWPPKSTLLLILESLFFFVFFVELWAKIHWTEMDRQWLSNELTEKEWLMNIADATHSAESSGSALMRTQNHSGCQRIFLVWIILAGSHWWQYYHPPPRTPPCAVLFCCLVLVQAFVFDASWWFCPVCVRSTPSYLDKHRLN